MKKINTAAINLQQVTQNQQKSNTKSKSGDNGFSDMMKFALVDGEEPNTEMVSSMEDSISQDGNTLIQQKITISQLEQLFSQQGLNIANQNDDNLQQLEGMSLVSEDNNLEEYLDDLQVGSIMVQSDFQIVKDRADVAELVDSIGPNMVENKTLDLVTIDDKLQNVLTNIEGLEVEIKSLGESENNDVTSINDLKNLVQDMMTELEKTEKVDINYIGTTMEAIIAKMSNMLAENNGQTTSQQNEALSSLQILNESRNIDVLNKLTDFTATHNLEHQQLDNTKGNMQENNSISRVGEMIAQENTEVQNNLLVPKEETTDTKIADSGKSFSQEISNSDETLFVEANKTISLPNETENKENIITQNNENIIKEKLQKLFQEVQGINEDLKATSLINNKSEIKLNQTIVGNEQELSLNDLKTINRGFNLSETTQNIAQNNKAITEAGASITIEQELSLNDLTKINRFTNLTEDNLTYDNIIEEENSVSNPALSEANKASELLTVQTGIESEEIGSEHFIVNTNVQSANTNFLETNITTQAGIKIDNLDEVIKEFEVQTEVIKNDEELTMKTKLKPVELGELSIHIEKKDNSIVARIIVESNETKEIIQKNMHLINDSIGDKDVKIIGIDVEDKSSFTNNFSFNSQGENDDRSNFLYDEESGNNSRTSGENVEQAYENESSNLLGNTLDTNSNGNVNILI